MKTYRLYVKTGGKWEMACAVEADDPDMAMRDAVGLLRPEQRKLPRELREADEPPPVSDPKGR